MINKSSLATGFTLTLVFVFGIAPNYAQQDKASPRERAGAVVFGQHCSTCHGVRLMKNDAAYDLTAVIQGMDEARFLIGAKTARGAMPSYATLLPDTDLGAVWAYVRRGHTPDLDDVPMESNH